MAEELINYIKENRGKGIPDEQIRQSLLASGWQHTDIDAAFLQLDAPPSSLPPFPIKPPSAQNPPLKVKEYKSFLNLKVLIAVVAVILLLTVSGASYFLFIKKTGLPGSNKVTETIENITGLGKLKTCSDIQATNSQEPETSLSAKFVLRETDQTSKKETFKLLDFNTKRESILNAQSPFTDAQFSPDGKYLIYKQRLESPPSLDSRNNIDIIKFFLFNTEAETTTEIIPSYKIDTIGLTHVMWSADSKQFMIRQDDDKTRKPENAQASYFNVEDLQAHDLKDLISASGTKSLTPYKFLKQNELLFQGFKQNEEAVQYEFAKSDLTSGSLSITKTFSIKAGNGIFTPDLKYYVFVEYERYPPFITGKSPDNKESSKELKAYIGYVNLEDNCLKKIEITEVPNYPNSAFEYVGIEQISEDSQKVLVSINSIDTSTYKTYNQSWRLNIASLTKQSKGINTTIDGDQINNIAEMSPLFNYAIVNTIKEKSYLMNLKTSEATPIPTEPSKIVTMVSWLKENPK